MGKFLAGVATGLTLAGFVWFWDWTNKQFDNQERSWRG